VVEVVNNRGVAKKPDAPARVDPQAMARVSLKPAVPCRAAREWRSGREHPNPAAIQVDLGPGKSEFIEFFTGKE
jgi:hypothetical protein